VETLSFVSITLQKFKGIIFQKVKIALFNQWGRAFFQEINVDISFLTLKIC